MKLRLIVLYFWAVLFTCAFGQSRASLSRSVAVQGGMEHWLSAVGLPPKEKWAIVIQPNGLALSANLMADGKSSQLILDPDWRRVLLASIVVARPNHHKPKFPLTSAPNAKLYVEALARRLGYPKGSVDSLKFQPPGVGRATAWSRKSLKIVATLKSKTPKKGQYDIARVTLEAKTGQLIFWEAGVTGSKVRV